MLKKPSAWLLATALSFVTTAVLRAVDPPTTAPETAPDSAPAILAPDFSTPKNALRSYIDARYNKDAKAIRDCVDIPPADTANVNAMLDMMVATDDLSKAAVKRFGTDGEKRFSPDAVKTLQAQVDALKETKIDEQGDHATAQPPDDPATSKSPPATTLVKTAAGWKIDGNSLINPHHGSPKDVQTRVNLAVKITAIARSVAAGIEAGSYTTAADAYNDYALRVAPVASDAGKTEAFATSVPATSPASTSAPQ